MGGNRPFFQDTFPKFFHVFNVVKQLILMEQHLRKNSPEINVFVFPKFFIQLCGIQPHPLPPITTENPTKPHEIPT